MTAVLAAAGILVVVFALLLWSRKDLRKSAVARDDLAEARRARELEEEALEAEARARAENETLR